MTPDDDRELFIPGGQYIQPNSTGCYTTGNAVVSFGPTRVRTKATDMTVHLHRDAEGMWAEVDEMPGCYAAGDTIDELLTCLAEAITLWSTD